MMLKRKAKKEPEVLKEVVENEKPQMVLKTEVVEEASALEAKPSENDKVADVSSVSQLASVVDSAVVDETPNEPKILTSTEIKNDHKVRKFVFGLVWILVAFVAGAGAGFGLSKMSLVKQVENREPEKVNTNVEVVSTVSPTKPVVKQFDRGTVKVKVLNGSGVKGAAGVKKASLESIGYKDVQTGNADSDNYDVSELSIKPELEIFRQDLIKDTKVSESNVSKLASDDAYDVLLIIGKK